MTGARPAGSLSHRRHRREVRNPPSDPAPLRAGGLLRPVRTEGNTRLYDSDTIERLEIILTLTRDLGVNLAGVEVILHMKEKIERMQGDVHQLLSVLREDVEARRVDPDRRYALTTVSKSLALVSTKRSKV